MRVSNIESSKSSLNKNFNTKFKGVNPELIKNRIKIELTQDIWAPRLNVKMPETPIEKEVVLEILKQRLQLDRLARLYNERFATIGKISIYNDLVDNNPNSKECIELEQELKKKGNLASYFKTLEKQIELEKKKNQPAVKYFESLSEIEKEFFERKILNNNKLEKIYFKIEKNNINKDGKYTTKELIEIIEGKRALSTAEKIKPQPILSRKTLLETVKKEYEKTLRGFINIYDPEKDHSIDAEISRQIVETKYANSIKRYPEIEKNLKKIYDSTIEKIFFNSRQLLEVDVPLLGNLWKEMETFESQIKKLTEELESLQEKCALDRTNIELQKEFQAKEIILVIMKSNWIDSMKKSVEQEEKNRETMIKFGVGKAYDYLTSESLIIKKHKEAYKIYQENNNFIPKDYWKKILG